ncbi:MAG: rhomboid family intramembrane serine protease [Alphaproteobacteria bacterium]|nr:MAG: rhomboid family intramembrane serine protease [Alphaproteobacteria bacterium]
MNFGPSGHGGAGDGPPDALPFHPVPAVVLLLAGAMTAVELLFQLGARGIVGGPGAVGWRLDAVRDWGVSDVLFEWMIANRHFDAAEVLRLLAYPFIHADFTHALFAVVLLLAMGKVVGEVFSAPAFLAVFFLSSAAGGIAYVLLLNVRSFLIGAYPGVYGLIGAFTWLLWSRLASVGAGRMRAFSLIGMLLGVQLVFGAVFGASPDWVADLAGFAVGFLLSFVVSPGGWHRLLDRLRER